MLKPGDYIRPTGRLIVGNVLDCNKDALERSLKFYDPQLYLKWNHKKRGGWGKWEIRRRPDHKSKVYQGHLNGAALYTTEYVEKDIVNHVLDLDVLQYSALERIKQMDSWSDKRNWVDKFEYDEARLKEQHDKRVREELRYNLKQHKREWREFAQLVSQGVNPGRILKGSWG
jgi:hypothetical protein